MLNESRTNLALWYLLVGKRLVLLEGMGLASGSLCCVDDSPQPVEWSTAGKMGENGQHFIGIAKSLRGKTVGCIPRGRGVVAIDWVTCRSLVSCQWLDVQSGLCDD